MLKVRGACNRSLPIAACIRRHGKIDPVDRQLFGSLDELRQDTEFLDASSDAVVAAVTPLEAVAHAA